MGSNKLKMLTPERLALITLAIILMVWALILMIKRDDGFEKTITNVSPVTDTIIVKTPAVESQTKVQKSVSNNSRKKDKSKNSSVKKRDHLNEPVSDE